MMCGTNKMARLSAVIRFSGSSTTHCSRFSSRLSSMECSTGSSSTSNCSAGSRLASDCISAFTNVTPNCKQCRYTYLRVRISQCKRKSCKYMSESWKCNCSLAIFTVSPCISIRMTETWSKNIYSKKLELILVLAALKKLLDKTQRRPGLTRSDSENLAG